MTPQLHCLTSDQRGGSYSVPRQPVTRKFGNGKSKPPNGAEANTEFWVEVMVETEDFNFNCLTHPT